MKNKQKLKFSVITPSFNQGEYIEQTIQSVLDQDYANFEHFVIDGGSTDQTISILNKYPHIQWISEKDKGQSDALNKGFKMAKGDIIAWINSDDWYETGAFKAVAKFFIQNPDKDIVMGDCNLIDDKGNFTLLMVDGGQKVYRLDDCTTAQIKEAVELMKNNGVPVVK